MGMHIYLYMHSWYAYLIIKRFGMVGMYIGFIIRFDTVGMNIYLLSVLAWVCIFIYICIVGMHIYLLYVLAWLVCIFIY